MEQVDRRHRQQLGRRQITVPGLVDPPIGAVRLAFGGDDIRVNHRHQMREIAHVGRSSTVPPDVELPGPEEAIDIRAEDLSQPLVVALR